MRWSGQVLLRVAMVFLVAGCAARKPRLAEPPVVEPGAIALTLQRSVSGWNEGNLEAFMEIYADNASFAAQEGFVRGKAAIRQVYAPAFAAGTVRDTLSLEKVEVEMLSPNVVLVRSLYNNSRNGVVTRRGTTTLVMRLMDGYWRIVHDHSN